MTLVRPLAKAFLYVENVSVKKFFLFIAIFLFLDVPVFAELNVIVIDPGHGGYDSGIKTPDSKEKDITLSIARQIKAIFRAEGRKAFLTRKVDRYLSFAERLSRAGRRAPDVFLSLHLSGSNDFAVYVTWYKKAEAELTLKQYYSLSSQQRRYLYESNLMSSFIEETLKKEFGLNVFHREMPLPVLDAISAPAVLIEIPSKGINYDYKMRRRMAYAIVIGVLFYEQQ